MGRRFDVLEGPAITLAARLRAHGLPLRAALLLEILPADGRVVHSDEERPELRRRLALVAADGTVPASLRAEAGRLARVAGDVWSALGRGGTVWIAWMRSDRTVPSADPGAYVFHWEGAGGDPDLYEEGTDTPDLATALAWGRHRSQWVIVRPSWDPGTSYWAGESRPPGDMRRLPPGPGAGPAGGGGRRRPFRGSGH